MRVKKSEQFPTERKAILDKLLGILGITESNRSFLLCDLDDSPEKQAEILALKADIPKYFSCGTWTPFKPIIKKEDIEREYMCLVRSLLKDMGVEYMLMTVDVSTISGERKRTQKYYIPNK